MRTFALTTRNLDMLVAAFFISVLAGIVFSESDFHRLPKITERSKAETDFTIFDPCATDKPRNRTVNCAQIKMRGDEEDMFGIYQINPHSEFHVRCDMKTDGGGWTVIQRRSERELEGNHFEKPFGKYENGFEESGASYWIGTKNLHALTNYPNKKQVLMILLTKRAEDDPIVLYYGTFRVGSDKERYQLTIDGYKGPPGYNALTNHNKQPFTTKEKKNGQYSRDSCSSQLSGGWWFNNCVRSNLNGQKFKNHVPKSLKGLGITWYNESSPNSYEEVFYKVEMKIRDADFKFCTGSLTYKVL